jgi:subtilisin-like proprotein convertase family protein
MTSPAHQPQENDVNRDTRKGRLRLIGAVVPVVLALTVASTGHAQSDDTATTTETSAPATTVAPTTTETSAPVTTVAPTTTETSAPVTTVAPTTTETLAPVTATQAVPTADTAKASEPTRAPASANVAAAVAVQTSCNNDGIAVPGAGSAGFAAPHASPITVDGAGNTTTEVTVQLNDLSHTDAYDLGVMLVSPTGQNLVLMNGAGGDDRATDVDLTFTDSAEGEVPHLLTTGTYLPTSHENFFARPPEPPESGATALSTFNGDDPNGTWSLYVHDDDDVNVGSIGGWCLTIASDEVAGATATALSASANPSPPGTPVTFTADVTSAGSPVTAGSVTFSDGGTPLGDPVAVVDGQATLATDLLEAGRHLITARFDGAGELAASSRSVVHTVATVAGGTWCNNEVITVPAGADGVAALYPSPITVDGAGNTTTEVTVQLDDVNHQAPWELHMMLVSPTGQSLVLMNDTGGFEFTLGVGLTFSDGAAGPLPVEDPLTTGTYLPTNMEDDDPELWMPPAPPESGATTLATFNGDDPNGTWSLYVADSNTGDYGWIGGWCLSIASDDVSGATATAVSASANPSVPGGDVTFTATVTSGGNPVTSGTVTFSDEATPLASVPVDANGRAVFTSDALPRGRHLITARFDGDSSFAGSSRSVVHTVTAAAGGMWCTNEPITVGEYFTATPYPSPVTVAGAGPRTREVTVVLGDVNHEDSEELNVLLVSPTGQALTLLADIGDGQELTALDLTFSDHAASHLPTEDDEVTSGSYRPTDDDSGGPDAWPAPAPAEPDATTLATFNSSNPNGTWSLYVYDDGGGDSGWIGGWCLDIVTDEQGPQARPTVSPAPNPAGWHRGDVTVNWNWSDAATGVDLARCTHRTAFHGEGARTLTAGCRDRIGNQSRATRAVRVDRTAPTVQISTPTARQYPQGAVVRADYACHDGLSGVARCAGTVGDGGRLRTSSLGRHQFTVTAVDRAGNRRSTTVTYTVITPPVCAGKRVTVLGTAGSDVLTGTAGADVILAGGGRDMINSRGGADTICAGAGDDQLNGLGGADVLDGGPGADICRGGPGTDRAVSCELTFAIP